MSGNDSDIACPVCDRRAQVFEGQISDHGCAADWRHVEVETCPRCCGSGWEGRSVNHGHFSEGCRLCGGYGAMGTLTESAS